MKYQLEQSVRDEVHRLFDAEDVESVIAKLQTTKLMWERSAPPPRVHIAVLWLSNGNFDKFKMVIDEARSDWRNTLVRSGLGNDDWQQMLNESGIDCSEWC